MSVEKKRVAVLVDGFNLYHAICALDPKGRNFGHLKWLDIKKLCGALIFPSKEDLIEISFFTALPPWDQDKSARHQKLLDVYLDQGVRVVRGKFVLSESRCHGRCKDTFKTYQEKMTDINICVRALQIADQSLADVVVFVTGDNDQASTIRELKRKSPGLLIGVAVPPARKANELTKLADRSFAISATLLDSCQLPDPYRTVGGRPISKPFNWARVP